MKNILSCPNLPSLPAIAVQLLELTGDPNVAMSDIAKLVQQDQALAVKVLKTVNSSFYGLSSPCGSIDRAMGYLGLNTVKSLVLGFCLVETTKGAGDDGFDLEAHWRRAIVGATGARVLAKAVGGVDAEEAFTAALFQDLGMLATFAAMKTEYAQTISGIPHRAVCQSEIDEMGFDHTQVGYELASKWKLPTDICEAIRCHHNTDSVLPEHQALAQVVSLGATICDAMDETASKGAIRKIERLTRDWYAKAAPDVGDLLEEVAEASRSMAKSLEQEIGELPDPAMLMAQANEQGFEHQLMVEREAHIDGLTRVANRKRFDAELARVFGEFQSDGLGFGVLFFDADKFKSVNDTYGHGAGDAVLIDLARRTSKVIGERGIVCRYGGEEFAVIVPGATLDECAKIAEEVRLKICNTPFDLSGIEGAPDELAVTVSIGVSSTDAQQGSQVSNGDQLVAQADECVYAAKNDGRNNVKVWGWFEKGKAQDSQEKQSMPAPASVPAPAPGPTLEPVIPSSHKGADSLGRILFVEDDALAATLVISLIKRRSKVDIQWVKSGTKACMLLESGKFAGDQSLNLVLCDFSLPGCNGHEVLRVAKRTPGISDVPFFMLTGSTDTDMRDESHRLGATKFIGKDEFCANVNKWLDEVFGAMAAA